MKTVYVTTETKSLTINQGDEILAVGKNGGADIWRIYKGSEAKHFKEHVEAFHQWAKFALIPVPVSGVPTKGEVIDIVLHHYPDGMHAPEYIKHLETGGKLILDHCLPSLAALTAERDKWEESSRKNYDACQELQEENKALSEERDRMKMETELLKSEIDKLKNPF